MSEAKSTSTTQKNKYSLYYTINTDIPTTNMTTKQKKELVGFLSALTDENDKKAVLLLVCEHWKVSTQQPFDLKEISLPYEGKQTGKDVVFNLDAFPPELQWILWKFKSIKSRSEK
jgi:ABC-type oligopeptide transport system substrate-binding subunit